MAKNTSFVLTSDLESFVREQIASGAYSSASEVMREALERFAKEQRAEAALRTALDVGLKSGRARPGVFARVRKKVAAR